jgi:hypothetical protein
MIHETARPLAILSVALLFTTPFALDAKDMYRWTDENGVVHFSDSRPPEGDAESLQVPSGPPMQGGNPYAQAVEEAEPSAGQLRREEIARANKEAREKQADRQARCESLQAELERLEPHRRVFFTNEDGETERMDDVERTDRVAELRDMIAEECES